MANRITPTEYMVQLKKTMMEQRGIAESSANTYISNLVLLNEKKVFNNLGFLKKRKDEIMEHLSQYADSTEMNYLSAVVSALSTRKDEHLYKTIYKFYKDTLNEKLGVKEEEQTNKKTEREKVNWIDWAEVEAKWEQLNEEVNKFKNDKNITKKNFETLLDFLVLSLYTLVPPRRNKDYMLAYILLKKDDKPLEHETKNYIDMEDGEMIFNHYKTAKAYGIQTEKIPDKLFNVLRIWIKFHPHYAGMTRKPRDIKLFVTEAGQAITLDNFITYRLNRIFDKKIGSTMLRHSYLTAKFGDEYNEIAKLQSSLKNKGAEAIAKAMGHNTEQQKSYIRVDE